MYSIASSTYLCSTPTSTIPFHSPCVLFDVIPIINASKWARQVEEYRPYAEDDTDYSKLRGELAKYNPASGVVDSIIALLDLP